MTKVVLRQNVTISLLDCCHLCLWKMSLFFTKGIQGYEEVKLGSGCGLVEKVFQTDC